MKLGLQLGYWGAQPPQGVGELVAAAEDAGFDAIFTAEAWGSDAFTPLAWWGRETSRVRLGTSIVQMSGRSPTSIAMHALTLDHLSGGRVVLGMGVSGPQVVEGWYGQPFGKPLARTREVVDIIRKVLAREGPVTNDGPHYPLPYAGEGAVGRGARLGGPRGDGMRRAGRQRGEKLMVGEPSQSFGERRGHADGRRVLWCVGDGRRCDRGAFRDGIVHLEHSRDHRSRCDWHVGRKGFRNPAFSGARDAVAAQCAGCQLRQGDWNCAVSVAVRGCAGSGPRWGG